jgi:hypothetical protein
MALQDGILKFDRERYMYFVGVYKFTKGDDQLGLTVVKYDIADKTVKSFSILPLKDLFKPGTYHARLENLYLSNVWVLQNGELIITAERRGTAPSRTMLDLEDIYVFKINNKQEISWTQTIHKNQTSEGYNIHTSSETQFDGKSVFVIWNDHKLNEKGIAKRYVDMSKTSDLITLVSAVDAETGAFVGRSKAFVEGIALKKMLFVYTDDFHQNSNQVGIYASDGKNFRLGWATLKR